MCIHGTSFPITSLVTLSVKLRFLLVLDLEVAVLPLFTESQSVKGVLVFAALVVEGIGLVAAGVTAGVRL